MNPRHGTHVRLDAHRRRRRPWISPRSTSATRASASTIYVDGHLYEDTKDEIEQPAPGDSPRVVVAFR